MPEPDAITLALDAARRDPAARDQLVELVYQQLRALAEARLRHERADHTLPATGLVHEAWIRLFGQDGASFENRAHFFGAAAEAMRRVLVDHARRRGSAKRGGGAAGRRIPLDVLDLAASSDPADVLALDEALERLTREDPRSAHVVTLRFFAGLSIPETATATGVSERSVARDWAFARARLVQLLEEPGPADDHDEFESRGRS